jgi:sugar (glycoside-pentoside-hexuronide) transporter
LSDNYAISDDFIIGKREKLSFFLANIGNIPIMTLVGTFLLKFYVDVVGLNPAAVATLFLVARIVDAVNDPITGYVIDHLPRTKLGRFRSYLILGSILCSLNYLLLWLGPSLATSNKLNIAYISYFLIGITFDIMDIPLNSMIPVMTKQGKIRDSLSLIKSLGYTLGAIIFTVAPVYIIESFTTERQGYHTVILIAVLWVLSFSIIGTLGIKERLNVIEKEKYKLGDLFKILTTRPVFTLFLSDLIGSIGSGAGSASLIFLATYVFFQPELVGTAAAIMVLGLIIGLFIGRGIIGHLGRKKLQVLGSFIAHVLSFFILILPPSEITWIYLIYLIYGVGGGMVSVVGYGMQADNIDYIEWKQGHRAEGAVASLTSFIQKAGLGIGAAIPGYILAATGYIPNAVQSQLAIQGIYWANVIIPTTFALISTIIIWIFYPLTKEKNNVIASELAIRRDQ